MSLNIVPKVVHPSWFFNFRRSEIKALFEALDSPEEGELRGIYQGMLFAIKGVDAVPLLRWVLYRFLNVCWTPWQGKSFTAGNGANIWLTGSGRFTFGEYEISEAPNQHTALCLSYNIDKNLSILRPIRGEIKKLSAVTYLARMLYETKTKTHTLAYFTLKRGEHS